MNWKQQTSEIKRCIYGIVLCLCFLCSYGCSIPNLDLSNKSLPSLDFDIDLPLIGDTPHLQEVAPPDLIQNLRADLAKSNPKVQILKPKQGSTLDSTTVTIQLDIEGLTVFQDPDFKMGPHIAVVLDDRDPIEIYDLDKELTLPDVKPGSHTLRAIAAYPWHESFKNTSAYDQISFDVLTSSHKNAATDKPVLTTSALQSSYSSEPVLVDFVVRQAQTNQATQTVVTSRAKNIQVKATVNDQSFIVPEADSSIYIEGLKEGRNWLKLELEDANGQWTQQPFSEQLYQFDFNPEQTNALGELMAGSINLAEAGVIVGRPKPAPPQSKTPPISSGSSSATSKKPGSETPQPKTEVAPKPNPTATVQSTPEIKTSSQKDSQKSLEPMESPTTTSLKTQSPTHSTKFTGKAPETNTSESNKTTQTPPPTAQTKTEVSKPARPLPTSRFQTSDSALRNTPGKSSVEKSSTTTSHSEKLDSTTTPSQSQKTSSPSLSNSSQRENQELPKISKKQESMG